MSNVIIQTLNTSGINILRENDFFLLYGVAKACLFKTILKVQ